MEMAVAAAYCSIDHEVADDIRYNDPMALLNLQAPKFAPHAAPHQHLSSYRLRNHSSMNVVS
jgi:hypothetical protein